jgi:hypothetical protein
MILELHLSQYGFDAREQIRRATCDLPTGTYVRVHTGKAMPPIYGIIRRSPLDDVWHRTDLTWGFVHADPRSASMWRKFLENLEGSY